MDQGDGNALLVERAAHVAVDRKHADAADSAGARQDDPVGLGGQRIGGGERMFRNKGLHGFDLPRRANAIRQIEGPGDLAAETVDVQGDTAHAGILECRLQSSGDPLVRGHPPRIAPSTTRPGTPSIPDLRSWLDEEQGQVTITRDAFKAA